MSEEQKVFNQRLKKFQSRLPENSAAIIFGASAPVRTNDVHYPFRQNSDFYYLTGVTEEKCALLVRPERITLFLPVNNQESITWSGEIISPEAAREMVDCDQVVDRTQLEAELLKELVNTAALYYHYGREPKNDEIILRCVNHAWQKVRRHQFAPEQILHPTLLLHEMRLIKDEYEISLLKESARITGLAHSAAIRAARPGIYEYDLDAVIASEFRKQDACEGYPSIVAAGENACILHYVKNRKELRENELVLIDAGAEKNYMTADVSRTFPTTPKFSQPQRQLYEVVLSAQKKAIAAMVVGSTMENVHKETIRNLVSGLLESGIITGECEQIIESEKYQSYYMHGTGHWLGIDVHDVGRYRLGGQTRKLENGMVATVEPGLYIRPDNDEFPPEFRGIGIRIEDDVLIRDETPLNLTESIPKEIAELEELRS